MTTKFTNPIPQQASVSKLFLKSDSADLKFAFDVENGTEILPAHKSLLAEGSSVFRNMVFSSVPETEATITIVDASISEFKEFLQFFYLEEVTLTMPNIVGVLRSADKYDVPECLDICGKFLEGSLTWTNLFVIYQLAATFNIEKLSKFCEDKIQHSTLEMFDSPAFLDFTKESLDIILLMDGLACTEIHIFNACIAWAKSSCRKNELNETDTQNLRQQLGETFYLIRFRAMSGEEVVQIMTIPFYAAMFSHKELTEVLCLRNVEDFDPENFSPKKRLILSFNLNKNPILVCRGGNSHYGTITKETDVFFQSTVPVLLNEIRFLATPKLSWLTFSIKITENNNPDDVLFNGSVTYGSFDMFGLKLFMSKVVVIKANTVYRISIVTDGINGVIPLAPIATVHTRRLMENIPVTFIDDPNPSVPPPRNKRGVSTSIVKSLHFKII